jgi:hypothetical protein
MVELPWRPRPRLRAHGEGRRARHFSKKIRRTACQGGPAGIATAAAARVSGEGGEDKAPGKPRTRGGFEWPT